MSILYGSISTSSGANKLIYAPEPLDVGRTLGADIIANGQKVTVMTAGPIDPGWLFFFLIVI